jgi:hypothetical protein
VISTDTYLSSARHLLSTSHRWETVSVHVDDNQLVHDLLTLFLPLSAPLLVYLAVGCVVASPVTGGPFHVVAPLVFGGHLLALSTLRLVGLSFPWVPLQPLPALVYLSLHALREPLWPTFSAFVDLLDSAPALRHLSLGDFGLQDVPPGASITLPFLHSLELFFGFRSALGRTLILFVFPNLSELHLEFLNLLSVRSFLDSFLAFSVSRVRLVCPCSQGAVLRALYARISDVSALDLQRCDDASLEALRFSPHHIVSDLVFPSLSQLYIFSPDWAVLHSVLESRFGVERSYLPILRCEIPSAFRPGQSLSALVALDFAAAQPPSFQSPESSVSPHSRPLYRAVRARVSDFAWIPVAMVPQRSSFGALPDLI